MIYDPKNPNRRVLVVDDTAMIHEDFKKVLATIAPANALDRAEAELFGNETNKPSAVEFTLTSAFQGQEAIDRVREALAKDEPFAVAFMDVRMPPGMDGVEATRKILELDERIQIVLCTAYSDHSWLNIVETVGETDRLLILKKPFDAIEIRQMALSLTTKWNLTLAADEKRDELQDWLTTLQQEMGVAQTPIKKAS
jgi:CheY-like chemotaxis protein